MLAEPRRKKRLFFNPYLNSKKFYTEIEGNSSIGRKMLEKMGWSQGKGLGKKEDGNVDHIRPSYKIGTKGMGFNKSDDKWFDNQNEFDSLLAELHSEYSQGKSSVTPSNLANKYKQSKNKVRYHRMVQGKDLSSRTPEEMNCILGVNQSKPADPLVDSVESTSTMESAVESEGFTYKGKDNLYTYFAKKTVEKRSTMVVEEREVANEEESSMETKSCEAETIPECLTANDETLMGNDFRTDGGKQKRKKKHKKRKRSVDGVADPALAKDAVVHDDADIQGSNGDLIITKVKKRKKKLKGEKFRETCEEEGEKIVEVEEQEIKDDNIIEDSNKNCLNKENLPSCRDSRKKRKILRKLKLSKKCKRTISVMSNAQSSVTSVLKPKKRKLASDGESFIDRPVKRVHFSDEVTVHPVAKHDAIRGGALREFLQKLQKWNFE